MTQPYRGTEGVSANSREVRCLNRNGENYRDFCLGNKWKNSRQKCGNFSNLANWIVILLGHNLTILFANSVGLFTSYTLAVVNTLSGSGVLLNQLPAQRSAGWPQAGLSHSPLADDYLSPEGSRVQGLPAIPVLHVHAYTMVQEKLGCPQVSVGSSYVQLKERRGVSTPHGGWSLWSLIWRQDSPFPGPRPRSYWGPVEWNRWRCKYQPRYRALVSLQYGNRR